jgi:hypothetical protein
MSYRLWTVAECVGEVNTTRINREMNVFQARQAEAKSQVPDWGDKVDSGIGLKVVGNEKVGGSGRWQMIKIYLGPW